MEKLSYKIFFDLTGKTAIVTGGLGILGKHFCSGLAEFGANVVVVDLDEKACQVFANELANLYKIKALGIGCNITETKEVQAMVQKVIDTFGEINILHNNAATKSDNLGEYFAKLEDYSIDEWRKIMSGNLDSMFIVAQAVGKQMIIQNTGGSIIQTSSIYGIIAPDQRIYDGAIYLDKQINTPAVYSTSKAGVVGLTKYLATYWADYGIRVNTLTPGGIKSGQNEQFINNYSSRVPLKRMGEPEEMVGALIFLASDASRYITGQNIIVDGGLSVW